MLSKSSRQVQSSFIVLFSFFLADISEFSAAFADHSALLKHELAYCLGQMKKTSALPTLESVLRDTSEDPMVRHEVKEPM